MRAALLALYLTVLPWGAPAPVKVPDPAPVVAPEPPPTTVTSTWYGRYRPGRITASGELFDLRAPACAHRTLPFGTVVKLRNPKNGVVAYVKVNDRGPAHWTGRDLDVTLGVARVLGFERAGVAQLELTVLGRLPCP